MVRLHCCFSMIAFWIRSLQVPWPPWNWCQNPIGLLRSATEPINDAAHIHSVERMRRFQFYTGHGQQSRVDITGPHRNGGSPLELAGRPFEDPWNAEASFVDAALPVPAAGSLP